MRRSLQVMFLQLGFNLRRIADQKKFLEVRILAQRHDGAANHIRRTKIAAHGVECDFHRRRTLRSSFAECKTKIVGLAVRSVSVEHATFGVAHPRLQYLRQPSGPGVPCSNRRKCKPYATPQRYRIVGHLLSCGGCQRWLLCACASASWMFCVLGLP